MDKNAFWNDAARCGALIAVVQILFSVAGMYWKSALLSLLSMAVFAGLIYLCVKRRVRLSDPAGYSYGQCMKYIFWTMVFAGILIGAWEIVARNVLFTGRYEQMLEESMAVMSNMPGLSASADQLDMAEAMSRRMLFSPLWVVALSVLGIVFQGCFFGLFIAAVTKRNPDIFADDDPRE